MCIELYFLTNAARNSGKYKHLFAEVQIGNAKRYARAITNFSFALQRFDSLTEPGQRLVTLLPEVLQFLCILTKDGDVEDVKCARSCLSHLTGAGSWKRICTAAMGIDALLILQKFLRKDDKGNAEVFLKASEASQGYRTHSPNYVVLHCKR